VFGVATLLLIVLYFIFLYKKKTAQGTDDIESNEHQLPSMNKDIKHIYEEYEKFKNNKIVEQTAIMQEQIRVQENEMKALEKAHSDARSKSSKRSKRSGRSNKESTRSSLKRSLRSIVRNPDQGGPNTSQKQDPSPKPQVQ
jgi:preprotein translocase subunit SecF